MFHNRQSDWKLMKRSIQKSRKLKCQSRIRDENKYGWKYSSENYAQNDIKKDLEGIL